MEYGQSPEDVREQPRNLVLQGQTDVYISRAEIDLKKAIQNLAFITHGQINSFPTLAALSLPSSAAALFWAIHAFLQHQYQKSNLENPIHRRNHDARLLFQQLARLDIDQWYDHSVDITAPSALSASIKFPFGPPAPGQLYRQHPLQEKYDCYYPVTNYFSQLFEEREIALLELLKDLGATKVTISDHSTSASDEGFSTQKVLKYPGRGGLSSQSIDTQQHPWLPYEPTWQTVVNDRFQKGILSTRFEFNLDVMGLLEAQIQTILQIMPGFDSMELPANCEEVLSTEMLQTKTVQVEFSKIQHKQSKTLEH
ncbi:MAG: hypothetical protein AAGH78_01565 [Cyanobacteria bacterium P01_H01_bin.58]